MAKIRNSNPKTSGGGYDRLVGDHQMADIFTKAQSTVITNGTELEKLISVNSFLIEDLDDFINRSDRNIVPEGVYLCTKKIIKQSSFNLKGHEPDFIAFEVLNYQKTCYVVELKDGDAFDTKKSLAEKEMLQLFVNHIAPKIPYKTKFFICCFNQLDKDKILIGFKSVFTIDEILTGLEFCEILKIDYWSIVNMRKQDAKDNFEYVVEKMFEIKAVRRLIEQKYKERIVRNDFYLPDDEED